MKQLIIILFLLFTTDGFCKDNKILSIEEYVTAYKNEIEEMNNSLKKDDPFPVYVDGVKIKMSVAVKKSATGSVQFWVVEAGADIEEVAIQEHELNLSFGDKGRQRVADKKGKTDIYEEIASAVHVEVLKPENMKFFGKAKLVAIPAEYGEIFFKDPSSPTGIKAMAVDPETKTILWRTDKKPFPFPGTSKQTAEAISLENSDDFKLVEVPEYFQPK